MPRSFKVAEISDLEPGEGKVVDAGGTEIALFNVEGSFHAIDNLCTHADGPLGDGYLEGEIVSCPLHDAQFNVKTGKSIGPPADCDVACYPVRVEGNDIIVEVE